jgi:hypothetical protein
MFDQARLERFSVGELLDSPGRSAEFAEAFAAQFLKISSLRTPSTPLAEAASTGFAEITSQFVEPSAAQPIHGARLVELDKVIKKASLIGLLACLYALVLWATSGFALFHPLFSALGSAACITFYCTGLWLGRHPDPK